MNEFIIDNVLFEIGNKIFDRRFESYYWELLRNLEIVF